LRRRKKLVESSAKTNLPWRRTRASRGLWYGKTGRSATTGMRRNPVTALRLLAVLFNYRLIASKVAYTRQLVRKKSCPATFLIGARRRRTCEPGRTALAASSTDRPASKPRFQHQYDGLPRPSKSLPRTINYNTRMDENPRDPPQSTNDHSRGPPLIGTPLLTALALFVILPLLVVLVVLLDWLF
jgi:hypothetical protein